MHIQFVAGPLKVRDGQRVASVEKLAICRGSENLGEVAACVSVL